MWPQSEERLYFLDSGDVALAGSPEEAVIFSANPDGSFTSPHGYRSTLSRGPGAGFTLTAHADGTRRGFYDTGHPLDIRDRNGNAVTFAYDSRDRLVGLTRVTNPATGSGPTWSFDYSTPWQTTVTDPRGHATTHHFDRRGRVGRVVDALGHERSANYDSNSNVLDRTSALGNLSVATFDADDNLKSTELPTGAVSTMDYDDPSHRYYPTRLTNPQGNASELDYSPVGNLETLTDAMAGVATLTHNPNGTVASSTDPRNNLTTFGYDSDGNLTRVTPPAPLGATTIAYDGISRPTSVTDGKGQVTTTSYDVMDRVTQVSVAGGPTVTLTYDAGGRLTQRVDATGTTTVTYDRLNRPLSESLPGARTNTYAYDPTGNLTSMTDVAGTLSYIYSAVNLVTSLSEPGGNVTTFTYDDDDNRSATTYPNGVSQSATYDDSGRVKLLEAKRGTTLLTRFDHIYGTSQSDTLLRRNVRDADGNKTNYTYDANDRLAKARTMPLFGHQPLSEYTYAYDAAGNRTSDQVGTATPVTATFNAADQLTSRGSVTYSYDANGNQTGSSAGQVLSYNSADQTTSLKRAGGSPLSATYAGAGQAERATAGTTSFTNTALGVSVATAGTSTVATTRDPAGGLVGLRSGTTRSYFLFDGLGSVVAVTGATGAVTNSYTYDPYGVTTETIHAGAVANPWRYAGQYYDDTPRLYKMGARYYQPELGRWTQPDPSGADANAYLYVGGNPVNFVDPSGLFSADAIVSTLFGGGIAAIVLGLTGNPILAGAAGGCATFAANKAYEGGDLGEIALDCLIGAVPGAAAGALGKAAVAIRNFLLK